MFKKAIITAIAAICMMAGLHAPASAAMKITNPAAGADTSNVVEARFRGRRFGRFRHRGFRRIGRGRYRGWRRGRYRYGRRYYRPYYRYRRYRYYRPYYRHRYYRRYYRRYR